MREEHERIQSLLMNTVTMLCRNGLQYNAELRIEGLIGVTVDTDEVFLVHINEKLSAFPSKDISPVMSTPIESRKRTHLLENSEHVEPEAKRNVVEIMPYAVVGEAHAFPSETDGSFAAEMPQSRVRKRRKKRRPSKTSEDNNSTVSNDVSGDDEDNMDDMDGMNNDSNIVVKSEPIDNDDELMMVGSQPLKVEKSHTKHKGGVASEDMSFEGLASAEFSGFGDMSTNDSLDASHHTSTPSSSDTGLLNQGGAFITGLVKNSAHSELNQSGTWDSLAGSLVPGIPTVSDGQGDRAWTTSGVSNSRTPSAAQGSSSKSSDVDIVGGETDPKGNIQMYKLEVGTKSTHTTQKSTTGVEGGQVYSQILQNSPTSKSAYYGRKGQFVCHVPGCGRLFSYETNCRRHERRDHNYFRKKPVSHLGIGEI